MHHDKFTVNISDRVLLSLNSITILFFYCKKLYNYIKLKVKTNSTVDIKKTKRTVSNKEV